jgi:hypothetical protein
MHRRGLSTLLASIAALALPLSASAIPIPSDAFTLNASVAFSITGASGTINPYLVVPNYAADAICLDGGCSVPNDFSNQDWIIFTVTVATGTLDEVGIGALFVNSIGAGYLANAGGTAPTSADATTAPSTPSWLFSSLSGTSAPLFVAYADGSLPSSGGPFGVGATNFMVRLGGTAQSYMGVVTTPVPEPGTALLISCALVILGVAGRSRRD